VAGGRLIFGSFSVPCALGRSGCRVLKREGDGATPIGRFTLGAAFYRPDRGRRPRTGLALQPLRPSDGWCDDPCDRNYNRPVRHPYPASAEHLWRADNCYDLLVVVGYNAQARVRGRGSAIFLHIAKEGLGPTEGCIALRRADFVKILPHLGRGASVRICG
jgi:L,D-peptidoglycan transpeptidase YkuD (ErfK/YbiS/YcfS/YnhG family)